MLRCRAICMVPARCGGSSPRFYSYTRAVYAGVEALPFRFDINDAVEHYETWAKENTPVITAPPLTSLTPYYLPFWVFECTVITNFDGTVTRDPSPRASLQIYAGHTFRRSATGILKTPVAGARQFTARMLEDAGEQVEIDVKALYESTAWKLVTSEITAEEQARTPGAQVTFGNVVSRQVMMPAYIGMYHAFGQDFRVYINATTGQGFSSQQTVFPAPQFAALRKRFLFLLPLAPLLTRLLFYPPALALSVASFFVLRAVHRFALVRSKELSWEEWVDQKARDMHLQSGAKDTWSYAQEFTREHKAPSPAKQAPKSSPKPTSGAPPPYVDPTDYYALLGIADKGVNASLDEIRSGFRRQLMKYHPDRAEAEGYDLDAASARTRQIYDAYAVLRDPSKRATYDASRKSSKFCRAYTEVNLVKACSVGCWSQRLAMVFAQALPFRVRATDAEEHFKLWALYNTPVFNPPRAESIRAVYLPFWVFECTTTVERLSASSSFTQTSDCIQVYAGQDVPRPHLDAWHVSSMIPVDYSPALLKGPGHDLPVHIEERKTFEATALKIAKEMVEKRARSAAPNAALHIKLDGIKSRQVLFPGYIIEYCEFGMPFQCLVSGVTGSAFGVQQTVFPSKQFGAFVQRINSYRLKSFGSDARIAVRVLRFARRFSRILLRPPTLALGLLSSMLSPLLHVCSLVRTQKDVMASWKAQCVAEAESQLSLRDSWLLREGKGSADWVYIPPSIQQQLETKRRIVADVKKLQAEVQLAMHDGDLSDLRVVAAVASIYELFGVVDGPSAEPMAVRNAYKTTFAQLQPSDEEARLLRMLYAGLRQPASRRHIDEAYWRVHYQPDVPELYDE